MKIVRYGDRNCELPGMVDDQGNLRSLANITSDIDNKFLESGSLATLPMIDLNSFPIVSGTPRLGPCVSGVSKIICTGLNYVDHAEESAMKMPEEPILFMKATSSISGPFDHVEIPPDTEKLDWEVELAVVISAHAKNIKEEESMDYIAGYTILNDYSERNFQLEKSGQWVKGKSYDTFAPIGPWLITKDQLNDPHDLDIWLEVNGERRQNSNTRHMHFKIPYLISYISRFMTLYPGDIVATGTPPGVGLGMSPPSYLRSGDVVRLGIEGLGVQTQTIL